MVSDWVNLPSDSVVRSLWVCLHDAQICSIHSHLREQRVKIEIRSFLLPEDVRVWFQIETVCSVRVNKTHSPSEDEWCGKWREESMNWQEFETAQAADPMNISNADLVTGENGVTLRLSGSLDGEDYDDLWCTAFIHGHHFSVTRSDDPYFTLEQFLEMGRRWWESFGIPEDEETPTSPCG